MTLIHPLRTDLQHSGDLRPGPAGLSCLANLVLRTHLCHLAEELTGGQVLPDGEVEDGGDWLVQDEWS
jgi:hypothetical protein